MWPYQNLYNPRDFEMHFETWVCSRTLKKNVLLLYLLKVSLHNFSYFCNTFLVQGFVNRQKTFKLKLFNKSIYLLMYSSSALIATLMGIQTILYKLFVQVSCCFTCKTAQSDLNMMLIPIIPRYSLRGSHSPTDSKTYWWCFSFNYFPLFCI